MAGVYSARVVSARKPGGLSAPADGTFHLVDTPALAETAPRGSRWTARASTSAAAGASASSRRGLGPGAGLGLGLGLGLIARAGLGKQVADPEDPSLRVYVFDVVALGCLPTGLARILADPTVQKLFHDCRRDSDALYQQHGVALQNVLDTQLCNALKWRNEWGRLPDYVTGLKRVLADSGLMRGLQEAQRLKDSVSARFDSDLQLWERRPLDEDLVKYAAYDVVLLAPLADHLTAGFQAEHLALARRASARYVALFRDAPEAKDRQAPGGRGRESARLNPALFA
eukprot:tig00000361_g24356.t1